MKARPGLGRRLLAALALLAGAAFGVAAETSYFASDEAAFEGEELGAWSPAKAGGPDYVLAVTRGGASETRVLLKKGEEVERRVLSLRADGRLERLYEGGLLSREEAYGAGGELLDEKVYKLKRDSKEVELAERTAYSYSSPMGGPAGAGRPAPRLLLVKAESFGADGASRGALEYRYDAVSRLVELRASGSFGKERAGASLGSGGLAAAWASLGEGLLFVASYEGGRPLLESLFDAEGKTLESVSYSYAADGSLASTKASDARSGVTTETSYDAGLRPLLVTRKLGLSLLSTQSLSYDEKGRLIVDELEEGAMRVKKSLSYGEAGTVTRIETAKAGILLSVETIEADSSSLKELYDGGLLFLKVYSKGGRVLREEFMSGGKVQRVRVFP